MKLKPGTKLAKALSLHPDVLPYIISLNPREFERLNTPFMRKSMSPRITLARLANMVQMPIGELVAGIYAAAHMEATMDEVPQADTPLPVNSAEAPDWITKHVVETVDLLPSDERLDADPFVSLFPALKRADVGDVLLMKHKWEPQPFYDVWHKVGVDYFSVQKSPVEWWIYLRKTRESYRASG